jgi:hypothetical protein
LVHTSAHYQDLRDCLHPPTEEIRRKLESIPDELINAIEVHSAPEDEIMEQQTTSDVAKQPDAPVPDDSEPASDSSARLALNAVLLASASARDADPVAERQGLFEFARSKLSESSASESSSSSAPAQTNYATRVRIGIGENDDTRVRIGVGEKGTQLVNEFVDNQFLLFRGFPMEFPLGAGLKGTGGLPPSLTRHLLLQFKSPFAANSQLIMLLFNQMQRHKTARSVARYYAKGSPAAIEALMDLFADPQLLFRLEYAIANPKSQDFIAPGTFEVHDQAEFIGAARALCHARYQTGDR